MSIKSVLTGLFFAAGLASAAHAAPLDFELTEFTGNNSRVHVTVTQQDANTLAFSLTQPVQAGEEQGEFRAFYFNVANESILSSLSITGSFAGSPITVAKSANNVESVGNNDTNLNGGGLDPFDVGIAFGGTGNDGMIFTANFTVAYAGGLDLATFFPSGADDALFGVRLKPFANGSSKLACDYPCGMTSSSSGGPGGEEDVPVPASLALLGAGLLGLGLRRRKA